MDQDRDFTRWAAQHGVTVTGPDASGDYFATHKSDPGNPVRASSARTAFARAAAISLAPVTEPKTKSQSQNSNYTRPAYLDVHFTMDHRLQATQKPYPKSNTKTAQFHEWIRKFPQAEIRSALEANRGLTHQTTLRAYIQRLAHGGYIEILDP